MEPFSQNKMCGVYDMCGVYEMCGVYDASTHISVEQSVDTLCWVHQPKIVALLGLFAKDCRTVWL